MAIGGSAGYLTVNPTQDYVGQALQGANESFARIRAEKYQKERDKMTADQNLQEQRRRDFKDAEEFSAKYPYAAMGDNDKQLVMNLKKTYTEARRDVINTGSEKSQALADKAISNLIRLENQKKAMSLKADEMLKNEKDYNPTSFNKAKNLIARANKDIVTRLDDNGNIVSDLVKRDDNGIVIGIEKKDISDGELKQMFEIEPKFDVTGEKGLYSQFNKIVGKPSIIINDDGANKITTTSYPEAESAAETIAKEATQNHSAMYWAMEQIKEDSKGNPITLDPEDKSNYSNPEVLKMVHDFVKSDLMKKAPTSISKEKNYAGAEFRNKVNQQNIDNDIARQNLKLAKAKFTQDQLEAGYVTIGETKYIFTPEGKAAQKKFYSNPDNKGKAMTAADYPADQINYYVQRTSKKVNPNASKTPAKPAPTKPTQTQDQWNAAWAKLKKGQSMKGLDGNTYTKS